MNQRNYLIFGILLLAFLFPTTLWAQRGEKITTVVIDPGHGGRDSGALGAISKEKDINLTVALLVGGYITQNCPDVHVIYTRETDVFVTLNERAAIANRANADVFISIHCNSTESRSPSAVGAETYVLGEHRNAANLEVARTENASILYEENAEEQYNNFDLNSPEAYIALSLFQNEYLNQSLQLAANVQDQFTRRVGRRDRGVQQAGFLVLWKTAMPSILIELGFISNASEERFLASEDGQVYMASAIFRAFRDFKASYEGENLVPANAPATAVPAPNTPVSSNTPVTEAQPATTAERQPAAAETAETQRAAAETAATRPATAAESRSEVAQPATPSASRNEVVFKVQFAMHLTQVPLTDRSFANVPEVDVYFQNGAYRYTSGNFRTKREAVERQAQLQRMGFSDAFVVAFINGWRVSVSEAENAL